MEQMTEQQAQSGRRQETLSLSELSTLTGKQIGLTVRMPGQTEGQTTQYKGCLSAVEQPDSRPPYLVLTDTRQRAGSAPFKRVGSAKGEARVTLPWAQVVYAAQL